MKLLHLSDLHLGKRLNNFSFLEDQEYILTSILRIIDDVEPQVVMISGDVYDKSIPSGEAVQLFDNFLNRLAKRDLQILIISGNHDSAERLSFGNRLLERAGIHLSPVYDGNVKTVTISDEYGEVRFYLLPFLKPAHLRQCFPEETVETYTEAMALAVKKMQIDTGVRNVLLTHQFVTGASTCESEDRIVGGIDNVDASVFADFDYVALGHIHGPQNVGSNRIRYCGTPLKYSFSEEHHIKSVTVVELGEKGELKLELFPLVPGKDMRTVQGLFAELMDSSRKTDDYIRVILTDEEDVPEAYGRLRVIYPNIMDLQYDNTRTRSRDTVGDPEEAQNSSPLEIFEKLYDKQNGQPMSQEQRDYCINLIESLEEGKA